ncbi:dihydroorotate dehydrogenase-like protein [Deltaproteobacteria bacterium TL4]
MDLRTAYMGLELKNPIVVAASPLSETVDNIRQMEDCGAGAVVTYSLFEEQIKKEMADYDEFVGSSTDSNAEALTYFSDADDFRFGAESYLETISKASKAVDIPIIGSLSGITNEGWIDYAREIQEAGAKGIELNMVYIPADLSVTGREVEQRYLDILHAVKKTVSIPIAIKVGPYFSAMANIAKQFDNAGADAIVMFNRFLQPDFDIERLEIVSDVEYSSSNDLRRVLLWVAVLYGQIKASLAATGGVKSADEIIKYLLAGADVVMTTSVLHLQGIPFLRTLLAGLERWMEVREFASVKEIRGIMSRNQVPDSAAFERANYIKILKNY